MMMRALWNRSPPITASLVFLFSLAPATVALRVTPGSPCEGKCTEKSTNTTTAQIVCLDSQYGSTETGANFQSCLECELRSTYGNPQTGETDVSWGLYNLRYAFSTCVYGYPGSQGNTSTPCLVSCQPMFSAIEYDLQSPNSVIFDTFCGVPSFADNLIDMCEFCYSLTSTQRFLANFLQAVRYGCRYQTPSGSSFAIDPDRIFNTTVLPSSTAPITTGSSAPSSGGVKNLTLVIALPIVGFVILLCATCAGCFFLIRYRRKKARARSHSQYLHARSYDTTITTPGQASWGEPSPYNSPTNHVAGTPTFGTGFDFVDYDGRRHDVGISKMGFSPYMSPVSPTIPIPAQLHHPENEKTTGH
ncbi:hypothetical protein VTN00DRAFT_823 [Thermoascus crustaceus]|uniref:uncharacterized protein n=1 Tax=Thermoascus crustaceus TaxID=5088 RepID=UPI003743E289